LASTIWRKFIPRADPFAIERESAYRTSSKPRNPSKEGSEGFYRFSLFTGLDTRLSYQYIIDSAFIREYDNASVINAGFRSVF
jgi:hypothetical protein